MDSRQEGFFAAIAFFVCVSWATCLFLAIYSATGGGLGKIEKYGQAGDTFGSINALFTGLALIGVAYTVASQRAQTKVQEQQVLEQRAESSRQAREQFLTARLNARVAALQSLTAKLTVLSSHPRMDKEAFVVTSLDALNQASLVIEVLSIEAKQGFDGGSWTPSVEKEAIREYVVKSLAWVVASFDNSMKYPDTRPFLETLISSQHEFHDAAKAFRIQYPQISHDLWLIAELLHLYRDEPAKAVEWCRTADVRFVRGQSPWV